MVDLITAIRPGRDILHPISGRSRIALRETTGKVFTDPGPVLQKIEEAALSGNHGDTAIADEIHAQPDRFGEMRGRNGRFVKPSERQARSEAKAALNGLRSRAASYIRAVHSARETLARERVFLADRARTEVKTPSVSLVEAIGKGGSLSDSHKTELKGIVKTLEQRFGDDLSKVRGGKSLNDLSQKHALDIKQLGRVREALSVLDKGRACLRAEARQIQHSQSKSQDRGGPVR